MLPTFMHVQIATTTWSSRRNALAERAARAAAPPREDAAALAVGDNMLGLPYFPEAGILTTPSAAMRVGASAEDEDVEPEPLAAVLPVWQVRPYSEYFSEYVDVFGAGARSGAASGLAPAAVVTRDGAAEGASAPAASLIPPTSPLAAPLAGFTAFLRRLRLVA